MKLKFFINFLKLKTFSPALRCNWSIPSFVLIYGQTETENFHNQESYEQNNLPLFLLEIQFDLTLIILQVLYFKTVHSIF